MISRGTAELGLRAQSEKYVSFTGLVFQISKHANFSLQVLTFALYLCFLTWCIDINLEIAQSDVRNRKQAEWKCITKSFKAHMRCLGILKKGLFRICAMEALFHILQVT